MKTYKEILEDEIEWLQYRLLLPLNDDRLRNSIQRRVNKLKRLMESLK